MKFVRRHFQALAASVLLLPLLYMPVGSALAANDQGIDLNVTIPEISTSKQEFEITNAQFRWGLSKESTSGAFAPGTCNFLSAGIAGDAEASREWHESDGFYAQKTGEVRIEKPHASGIWVGDSWETKCLDRDGRRVGTSYSEQGTGAQIVIEGGTGTINTSNGTASIKWKGSFTSAMYNGMTYWSATDPELTVAGGKGTLTATLSGYGTDREDTSKWSALTPQRVVLASLPSVSLGDQGIVTDPSYKKMTVQDVRIPQLRTGDDWGSFPQAFVDFQEKIGQSAYWYSTGSGRDPAKVASTLYISYTPEHPVLAVPPPNEAVPNEETENSDGDGLNSSTSDAGNNNNDISGHLGGNGSVINSELVPGTLPPAETALLSEPLSALLASANTSTVDAATWLGESLIPGAIDLVRNYKDWLLFSIAGLLGLSTLAWIGFLRGWFILPFNTTKDQK